VLPKPTLPTRWADVSAVNRVAVDPGLRDVGFPPGTIVPSGENNERQYEVGEWLTWLAQFLFVWNSHQYLFLSSADLVLFTGSPTPTSAPNSIPDGVDVSFPDDGTIRYAMTRVVVAGNDARLRFAWGTKTGPQNIGVFWTLLRPTSATNPFGAVTGDSGTFAIAASSGTQAESIDAALTPGVYLLQVTLGITGSTGTNSLNSLRLALTYGAP
jgi:hypothetical protein